jgi:hypothetical protein
MRYDLIQQGISVGTVAREAATKTQSMKILDPLVPSSSNKTVCLDVRCSCILGLEFGLNGVLWHHVQAGPVCTNCLCG